MLLGTGPGFVKRQGRFRAVWLDVVTVVHLDRGQDSGTSKRRCHPFIGSGVGEEAGHGRWASVSNGVGVGKGAEGELPKANSWKWWLKA